MQIDGYGKSWRVDDSKSLEAALAWRDRQGGAIFFLAADSGSWPVLAIRISGDVADVIYFPREDHPGFRLLGGQGLPEGEFTTLVYEGADPTTGELTPNEFIVPFGMAVDVAREFLRNRQMATTVSWYEL